MLPFGVLTLYHITCSFLHILPDCDHPGTHWLGLLLPLQKPRLLRCSLLVLGHVCSLSHDCHVTIHRSILVPQGPVCVVFCAALLAAATLQVRVPDKAGQGKVEWELDCGQH